MLEESSSVKSAKFVRLPYIIDRMSISRSSLYRMISEGEFPAPMKVGGCAVWLESDVDQWVERFLAANIRHGER